MFIFTGIIKNSSRCEALKFIIREGFMSKALNLNNTRWECEISCGQDSHISEKRIIRRATPIFSACIQGAGLSPDCEVLGKHMIADHARVLISIPPKYSVSPSHRIHQR